MSQQNFELVPLGQIKSWESSLILEIYQVKLKQSRKTMHKFIYVYYQSKIEGYQTIGVLFQLCLHYFSIIKLHSSLFIITSEMKAKVAHSDYDYLFKVILIGDSSVGKAALLNKLSNPNFQTSNFQLPTIGVDFKIRTIELNGKTIKLQMWDTSGQQRFRTITNSYFKGAHAIILVYDIADIQTFKNIQIWMAEIHKYTNQNVIKVLIGNNINEQKSRAVSTQEGRALAYSLGINLFFETDRKDTSNTQKYLAQMVKELKNLVKFSKEKEKAETTQDKEKQANKKSKGFFNRIGQLFGVSDKVIEEKAEGKKDISDVEKVGLSKKGVEILKQNEINTIELLLLATEDDLKEMNLPMGDRIIIRSMKK